MSALATASELIRGPLEIGKMNFGGRRKKEELEREVSELQTMLSHEDKVREILQQAHNRKPGIGMELTFPNHIPPHTKELLTELATVEDEIVRLESEIEQLQKDAKIEQEATKELKSKQFQNEQAAARELKSRQLQSTTSTRTGLQANTDQSRVNYETKALHFISKAINGDYNLTDFTIHEDKVASPVGGYPTPFIQNPKETVAQERVSSKRSGMLKPTASPLREFRQAPASPLRDFRHPTPKPQERSIESRSDTRRKALSGPAILEETTPAPKYSPNKLSENIMKTLILLYVRLIRTSRQSELEKSGPISRSMFSSQSFRTEPGVNLSTSLVLQKESRQPDPYGVFNIEGAVPRDIGPYKNLVVFSSSSLDPKYVSHSSSIPLFQKLRSLFGSLQKVDLRSITDQQKLAFWINIYNACIMHGFLKFGVPSNPEKLLSLLNKATLNVGGKVVNAQAIERCILRKPEPSMLNDQDEKANKEAIIHKLYGLSSVNPYVIFTLCCGTRSSPAVRIYTAEGVTSELEKSKLEYLQASISVTNLRKIWLPELLTQNMQDFAKDMDSLIHWVCNQLPTSGSLRKSIVDCFRSLNNSGRLPSINVEKMSYDFEFQYLLQV